MPFLSFTRLLSDGMMHAHARALKNHLLTENIDETKDVTQLLVTLSYRALAVSQDSEGETRLVYAFKACEQKLKEEAEQKPFIKYSSIPELQFYPLSLASARNAYARLIQPQL